MLGVYMPSLLLLLSEGAEKQIGMKIYYLLCTSNILIVSGQSTLYIHYTHKWAICRINLNTSTFHLLDLLVGTFLVLEVLHS